MESMERGERALGGEAGRQSASGFGLSLETLRQDIHTSGEYSKRPYLEQGRRDPAPPSSPTGFSTLIVDYGQARGRRRSRPLLPSLSPARGRRWPCGTQESSKRVTAKQTVSQARLRVAGERAAWRLSPTPSPSAPPVFTGATSPHHPRGLTRRRRPSQLQGGSCSLRIRLYAWFLQGERTQPCDGSGRRIRQPVWSKEP